MFVEFTVFGAAVSALLVGGALGLFNGLMIVKLEIPPFVATLGMLSIARGLTRQWTGGFPIPVWITLILVLAFAILTTRTRLGRYIFAVGSDEQSSHLSGININGVKLWVYTLAGFLAAFGGILVTSRLDSAQPNAGTGYELDSIAAVVIGGTSLSGGRGSILGTVMGCLIIGILNKV